MTQTRSTHRSFASRLGIGLAWSVLSAVCFAGVDLGAASVPPSVPDGTVSDATVLARSAAGDLTVGDLRDRVADRPLRATPDSERQIRARLEQLVVDRELERRFVAAGGLDDAEYLAWRGVLERRLLGQWLERSLAAEARPTDSEIAAASRAETRRETPRRWRLRNIFLERETAESGSAAIRALSDRLTEAPDPVEAFADAARRLSSSRTNIRGGKLGWASLDELSPPVADVVAGLEAGELSPVIETDDGWTLLYCEAVIPARRESDDALARRVGERLHRGRLEALRAVTMAETRTRLTPSITASSITEPATVASSVVVRFADGSTITRRDLALFARDRGLNVASGDIVERAIESHLRAAAAQARGAADDEALRQHLATEEAALRAELQLRRLAVPRVVAPSTAEIDALYAQRIEAGDDVLETPARVLARVATLSLVDRTRAEVSRFESLVRGAGEPDLDGLAAEVPAVRIDGPSWLGMRRIFELGKGADEALTPLLEAPAAQGIEDERRVFGPFQEGRELLLVEVLDRRSAKTLTRAEAEPRLRAALERQAVQRARRAVARDVLAAVELEILRPELLATPETLGLAVRQRRAVSARDAARDAASGAAANTETSRPATEPEDAS